MFLTRNLFVFMICSFFLLSRTDKVERKTNCQKFSLKKKNRKKWNSNNKLIRVLETWKLKVVGSRKQSKSKLLEEFFLQNL